MGHVWFGGHFSPPNKEQLGWLAGDVLDVAPPGGTFSLAPYEIPGDYLKVLRVPVVYITDDFADTTFYYVSYRRPLGFDGNFPELLENGAILSVDARRLRIRATAVPGSWICRLTSTPAAAPNSAIRRT